MYKDTTDQIAEVLTAVKILSLYTQTEWKSLTADSDQTKRSDLVSIAADIRQFSQTLIRIGGSEVTDSLGWLSDNAVNIQTNLG